MRLSFQLPVTPRFGLLPQQRSVAFSAHGPLPNDFQEKLEDLKYSIFMDPTQYKPNPLTIVDVFCEPTLQEACKKQIVECLSPKFLAKTVSKNDLANITLTDMLRETITTKEKNQPLKIIFLPYGVTSDYMNQVLKDEFNKTKLKSYQPTVLITLYPKEVTAAISRELADRHDHFRDSAIFV